MADVRRALPFSIAAGAVLAVALAGLSVASQHRADRQAGSVPVSPLQDQEFWRLSSTFSEPDGTFHSENLVSNESAFQSVIPSLVEAAVPGRVYLGVGSEQNFTYMAAVQPSMAFIVDVRRGNLDLHLLYKALFELSANRAEFVSRVFGRPQPPSLTTQSSAAEIFAAYAAVPPSEALFRANLDAVYAHLATRHGFALGPGDREGIRFVYEAWFDDGPDIRYALTNGPAGFGGFAGRRGPGGFPTYADLMTARDEDGHERSYLATEDFFRRVKSLEERNLVVPVVGNFGGPKALRAVASYLKQRQLTVSAFYVSNVEQYLRQDGIWEDFCGNASTLPADATSLFIRSTRGGFAGQFGGGGRGPGGFGLGLASIRESLAVCTTH